MKLSLVTMTRRTVFASIFVNMIIGSAIAGTWRVEQDGSGDWSTLQEASDGAVHGDTLLVGPGRYYGVEVTPWAPSHYQKTLTYIGENVDSVIVGPEEYQSRYGMFIYEDTPQHFRNMTFENMDGGISFQGGTVDNCKFIGCLNGISLEECNVPSSITNCIFEGLANTTHIGSSLYARLVGEVLMEDCLSKDMKIYVYQVDDYIVRNCSFPKTIAYEGLSHNTSNGLIEGCEISGMLSLEFGTLTIRGCDATVNDIEGQAGRPNLSCSFGEMILENNVLHGSSDSTPTIVVGHDGWVHGSGNHILKSEAAQYTVYLQFMSTGDNDCDLRNNFWGTDDADELSAWIWDVEDDPGLHARVLFDPYSSVPLSTEKKSMGLLKSMFR